MEGGYTFREWIESNKRSVLSFLQDKDWQSTRDILSGYRGEKDIYQVRKAVRELASEGKILVKDEGWNYKKYKLE